MNKKILILVLTGAPYLLTMEEPSQHKRKIPLVAEASAPKKARTDDVVIVIDAQGYKHNIAKDAALGADLLKNMLEDNPGNDELIPLPNISYDAMERLIQRLTLLLQPEGKEVLKKRFQEMLQPVDPLDKFLNFTYGISYEDAQTADYVDARELLQLTVEALVYKMFKISSSEQDMINQICSFQNLHIQSLAWDTYREKRIKNLKKNAPWAAQFTLNHHHPIDGAAFSPDGRKIIIGTSDTTARIWDIQTRQQMGEALHGHTAPINAVAFSPDGTKVATASLDGTARIWDVNTQQTLGILRGHAQPVMAVAFSPDNTKIVTGSTDNMIRLWDVNTYQQIGRPFQGHSDWITTITFSPDGTALITGSIDKTVRIWDIQTHQQIGELRGHTGPIHAVAVSPDGTKIATGSEDKTVRIWDAQTYQPISEPLYGPVSNITVVSFSPDSKMVATGSQSGVVTIFDANSFKRIAEFPAHERVITALAFSPDGAKMITSSRDKRAIIWHQPKVDSFLVRFPPARNRQCPQVA